MELIIASSLLLLFFSGVFMLFHRGTSTLKALDSGGNAQADMLRLKVLLRSDFLATDFGSVTLENNEPTSEKPRNAVSCVILDDWSDDNNFSTARGGPDWNQRVAYVPISGEKRLERIVFVPESQFLRPIPLERIVPVPPDETVRKLEVSADVPRFEVIANQSTQQVRFKVTIAKAGEIGISGDFLFSPRNTKPKL